MTHIQITIDAESAEDARAAMARLLGETRREIQPGDLARPAGASLGGAIAAAPQSGEWAEEADKLPPAASIAAREAGAVADAPKRERGQPSPGRARRTKAEIAEDEAADKTDASAPASEPVALISTGEERIDPTTPEDTTQDAADEAAEAEATKAPELTHDDVRAALKKYLDAYGTPAAMEDGPKVLKLLFGEKAAKVSDVPTDQASLAKAIAGIEEMLTKNPFARIVQL
jgi:hypothetical protein